MAKRSTNNSGKRQQLLAYLSKKEKVRYKKLMNQLDIREPKTR